MVRRETLPRPRPDPGLEGVIRHYPGLATTSRAAGEGMLTLMSMMIVSSAYGHLSSARRPGGPPVADSPGPAPRSSRGDEGPGVRGRLGAVPGRGAGEGARGAAAAEPGETLGVCPGAVHAAHRNRAGVASIAGMPPPLLAMRATRCASPRMQRLRTHHQCGARVVTGPNPPLCHGWMRGLSERPISSQPVEAWRHGPLIADGSHNLGRIAMKGDTAPGELGALGLSAEQGRVGGAHRHTAARWNHAGAGRVGACGAPTRVGQLETPAGVR